MGEEWGGVEEVSTIAVLQAIQPNLRAVLIKFNISPTSDITVHPGTKEELEVTWDTNFEGDEVRRKYHDNKMASKDSRPMKQLERLGMVNAGTVFHIEVNM